MEACSSKFPIINKTVEYIKNGMDRRKSRSSIWLSKLFILTVKIAPCVGRIQSEPRAREPGAEHLTFLEQLVQKQCTHHF